MGKKRSAPGHRLEPTSGELGVSRAAVCSLGIVTASGYVQHKRAIRNMPKCTSTVGRLRRFLPPCAQPVQHSRCATTDRTTKTSHASCRSSSRFTRARRSGEVEVEATGPLSRFWRPSNPGWIARSDWRGKEARRSERQAHGFGDGENGSRRSSRSGSRERRTRARTRGSRNSQRSFCGGRSLCALHMVRKKYLLHLAVDRTNRDTRLDEDGRNRLVAKNLLRGMNGVRVTLGTAKRSSSERDARRRRRGGKGLKRREGRKKKRGRTVDVDHSGPIGVLSLCSCCAAEV